MQYIYIGNTNYMREKKGGGEGKGTKYKKDIQTQTDVQCKTFTLQQLIC